MTKTNLIALLSFFTLVVGVLLTYYFYESGNKKPTEKEILAQESEASNSDLFPLGNSTGLWDEALSPFRDDEPKPYLEILEDLETGKINFVWEVWALRRKCDPNFTAEQCNATLLKYIETEYSGTDREKILDLFQSYFKYEKEIHQLELPYSLSFEDRYEKIKAKRRTVLGEEKTHLFFGMEESQVQFMEASANFIKSSTDMNSEDRVKKYFDLKKKTFGSFHNAMVAREDKFEIYQTEVLLREKELASLTQPEEKEKRLVQLETKYFGKEKAKELAELRKGELAEKQKIQKYEEKEKEFLSKNPNLSSAEKDKKLKQMRIEALGAEEADAYSRRKEIDALNNF